MTSADRVRAQGPELALLKPDGGAPASKAGVELQRLVAGINPLLGAASVLLALVAKLRATTMHSDPPGLRRQLLARVEEFEAAARAAGVPRLKIVTARYLLCSFIDEAIAATPWGWTWNESTLLHEFHDERWGGDKAFKLLERMGEDVAANADVLELFYVCLALGFEGRYRGQTDGRAQLDAIAARLMQVLRPDSGRPAARELSLRWTGVRVPDRARTVLPLWVVFAVGAVIVIAAIVALNARLDAQARPLFRQVVAIPAALRSDLLDQAAAAARPRLQPPLRADVAAGALEVRDEALRSVVVVPADALFASGSAEIDSSQRELLARVAAALAGPPGQIAVIGHTDDQPLSSVQFPSNWELSRARANAVMQMLAQRGVPAGRMHAEGRADAEPRARNDSASARARNRRVEIVLTLPRPEP
jgi:type VI secretion system protein ImpK